MKKLIYVDNAATTSVSPTVLDAMIPFFKEQYGNPSSIYFLGDEAKKAVEKSREIIANALNAKSDEIYFTSGGTESDNWAITGVAKTLAKKGKNHIITTKFEHHAVLHTVQALEREGFCATYLDVDENGLVSLENLENSIQSETALVTIMYANNEIGTIQPIEKISEICHKNGVIFHTDAVQAVGHIPINIEELNVDLLSFSGHKFHGPKGIGGLYIKKGVPIQNFFNGGAQEKNKRAGTENVAGIVGMAKALEESVKCLDVNYEKVKKLRNYLIKNILSNVIAAKLNGDIYNRLPGNVNISFAGIEGESLLLLLNENGICASSGSACTSRSLDPSHVLLAIGLKHEIAHGSLRITLSEENTKEEAEVIVKTVINMVERLRSMSPLWDEMLKKPKVIEEMDVKKNKILYNLD